MPLTSTTCDLSAHLANLCADLCRRTPALGHIDPQVLLFALSRSRAEGTHGLYARIAPLRFAAGAAESSRRRGRFVETYRMPSLIHEGRHILYLIHILFPRYLRLSFEQKLATLIHELYHISERCDGDIRRFAGRTFAHGPSRREFNRRVEEIQASYLASAPDPRHLAFLRLTEEEWRLGRIRLTGLSVPLPRARLVVRRRI
ncbi:MAG: putative metallopeptidase [Desulfuromonadales bacterium]